MKFFRPRSLRIDIITAFIALLLPALAVIIAYYHYTTAGVIQRSARDLLEAAAGRVFEEVEDFLAPIATLGRLSADLAPPDLGRTPEGKERLIRLTLELLHKEAKIAMAYVADERGNLILSRREGSGGYATKIIDRSRRKPETFWQHRDQIFRLLEVAKQPPEDFDPRLRPWYRGAKTSGRTYWTQVYIFHTGRKPGITCATPIIGSDGGFRGVLGLDLTLETLSDFVKSLKVGRRGYAFIFAEGGGVIAAPTTLTLAKPTGTEEGLRLLQVEELDLLEAAAAFRKFRREQKSEFLFQLGDQKMLATILPLPPELGQSWYVGLVVPQEDFSGELEQASKTALVFSLFILTAAVLLAVRLSLGISRPILQLAQETDKIKNFRLEELKPFSSHIREIVILQEAMDRMRVSLKSFSRFAPLELVREVVVKGQEAMLGGARRRVSVLFGDLRGFTALAERTSPEQVVQILNAHYGAMVELVQAHNGFVLDFLGDSIFAVFGASAEPCDHPWQAVCCAVAMQIQRRRLNQAHEAEGLPPLEMGIGINTGLGVVGNLGAPTRIKYDVIGHAVNLAARLESFSLGGQILLAEATHEAVADRIRALGPLRIQVKGLGLPVRVWDLRALLDGEAKEVPDLVPDLRPLPEPLPANLRLLEGKRIQNAGHPSQVVALALSGAEIASALTLEAFTPVQLELSTAVGDCCRLDGRLLPGRRPETYLIKFSPLSEADLALVRTLMTETAKP